MEDNFTHSLKPQTFVRVKGCSHSMLFHEHNSNLCVIWRENKFSFWMQSCSLLVSFLFPPHHNSIAVEYFSSSLLFVSLLSPPNSGCHESNKSCFTPYFYISLLLFSPLIWYEIYETTLSGGVKQREKVRDREWIKSWEERNEGKECREKRNSFNSMSTEMLFSFFIPSPSPPPFHFEILSSPLVRSFAYEHLSVKKENEGGGYACRAFSFTLKTLTRVTYTYYDTSSLTGFFYSLPSSFYYRNSITTVRGRHTLHTWRSV